MNKIITALVVTFALLISSSALAKDKVVIRICDGEVSIKVGHVEYVSKIIKHPHYPLQKTFGDLDNVLVFDGPDSVLYRLTSEGVNYSTTPKKQMSKASVAKVWAKHLKRFKDLKSNLEMMFEL